MSFLDKMIEKIGIVDEEYDEEEVAEKAIDSGEKDDESVPPEFLQHVPRKTISYSKSTEVEEGGMRVEESPSKPLVRPMVRPVEQPSVRLMERPVERKVSPANPANKLGSFFGKGKEKQETNPVAVLAKAMHVVIIHPESFDDSQQIAEFLKREQSVIVNFEKTDEVVAARINDFVCGVVYAVGGTIQKIDQKSMFCAPRTVNVADRERASE